MTIREIAAVLEADILTENPDLDREVHSACGSDMMSDVLAYVNDQGLLLTGLTNPQSVRTASMMDMTSIVFVRGRRPDEDIINLAQELDITVLLTEKTMFVACGLLYKAGLQGEVSECSS